MKKLKKYVFVFGLFFMALIGHAQNITAVDIQPCEPHSNTEIILKNRLIDLNYQNDTLSLTLGLSRHCHFIPKFELAVREDSLLISINDSTQLFAACECYYRVNLQITNLPHYELKLFYNENYRLFTPEGIKDSIVYKPLILYPSKYIFPTLTELKKAEPLNEYNANGHKVGPWMEYNDETGKYSLIMYAIDENNPSRIRWWVTYASNGELEKICASVYDFYLEGSICHCIDYDDYLLLE